MNPSKSIHKIVAGALSALVSLVALSGCHRCVYEDLSHCPQGVDFAFDVQTPCDAAPVYPEEVREARVFAFDETGTLLRVMEMKDLKLARDFTVRTDFYRIGKSDFLAWAGSDLSRLDFSTFEPGKTKRDDILVSLKRQVDSYTGAIPPIYIGKPVDGALTQEDRSRYGTLYDKVTIHLTQLTNRLRITLKGLDPEHKYSVRVEDDNSRYTLPGDFAKDSRFSYLPEDLKQAERTVTATIDVMRLAKGRHALLIVTDETDHKEIMRKNLIEELLLAPAPNASERAYSLDCDHTFDIVIDFKLDLDRGTYVAVRAIINQWNLVFRDVILH